MPLDLRLTDREQCQIEAKVIVGGEASFVCRVHDISEDGAQIEISEAARLPEFFLLILPSGSRYSGEHSVELRWQRGTRAGLQFVSRRHARAAAFLTTLRGEVSRA